MGEGGTICPPSARAYFEGCATILTPLLKSCPLTFLISVFFFNSVKKQDILPDLSANFCVVHLRFIWKSTLFRMYCLLWTLSLIAHLPNRFLRGSAFSPLPHCLGYEVCLDVAAAEPRGQAYDIHSKLCSSLFVQNVTKAGFETAGLLTRRVGRLGHAPPPTFAFTNKFWP